MTLSWRAVRTRRFTWIKECSWNPGSHREWAWEAVMKFSRLIFANLFRKKIRLALTIGSFAVALFLFSFLAVVRDAFSRGADIASADRLFIMNPPSITNLLRL